jgi:hypothetical protein
VWQSGAWLDDSHTVILDRVVFVYDHRRGHEKAIANALQRYVLTRPSDNWNVLLPSIGLARCKIRAPLVWCGNDEIDGATLLGSEKLPSGVTK